MNHMIQSKVHRIIRNDTYRTSHYCRLVAVAWQQAVTNGMNNGLKYSVTIVVCLG